MSNYISAKPAKKRRRLKKPIRDALNHLEMGVWFALGLYITARILLEFFCLI